MSGSFHLLIEFCLDINNETWGIKPPCFTVETCNFSHNKNSGQEGYPFLPITSNFIGIVYDNIDFVCWLYDISL